MAAADGQYGSTYTYFNVTYGDDDDDDYRTTIVRDAPTCHVGPPLPNREKSCIVKVLRMSKKSVGGAAPPCPRLLGEACGRGVLRLMVMSDSCWGRRMTASVICTTCCSPGGGGRRGMNELASEVDVAGNCHCHCHCSQQPTFKHGWPRCSCMQSDQILRASLLVHACSVSYILCIHVVCHMVHACSVSYISRARHIN